MTYVEIGTTADVPLRGARCVSTPHGRIAVFRTAEEGFFAIEDRCPHKGGPLSQGIVHGRAVTCPLHNWVISLASGEAQGQDKGCTPTIPVKVSGSRVLILRSAIVALAPVARAA
jgi:nitrite reductase (NADH) small subunit